MTSKVTTPPVKSNLYTTPPINNNLKTASKENIKNISIENVIAESPKLPIGFRNDVKLTKSNNLKIPLNKSNEKESSNCKKIKSTFISLWVLTVIFLISTIVLFIFGFLQNKDDNVFITLSYISIFIFFIFFSVAMWYTITKTWSSCLLKEKTSESNNLDGMSKKKNSKNDTIENVIAKSPNLPVGFKNDVEIQENFLV